MNLLSGLTDQPKQESTIVLADGSRAVLRLEYHPNQLCWVYDLAWGEIEIKGGQLTASPNILRQFRHRLPFGIAVLAAGDLDPTDQESFVNGSTLIYLLDAAEVDEVEAAIFNAE